MTELVIVRDQAFTPEEYARYEARLKRLREWGRKRHRIRMATDPVYRERRAAADRRYRATHADELRAYHREWMRRYRQQATQDRMHVASLHDLRCTGPTKATGCRCHKVMFRVAA